MQNPDIFKNYCEEKYNKYNEIPCFYQSQQFQHELSIVNSQSIFVNIKLTHKK